MKYKMPQDRILIDVTITDITEGGIILSGESRKKEQMAKVLAVGPGTHNSKGKFVKGVIEVGDMVLFPQYTGNKLSTVDPDAPDSYWIMRESEVIAVIKADVKPLNVNEVFDG